jgi:hypothetical protein
MYRVYLVIRMLVVATVLVACGGAEDAASTSASDDVSVSQDVAQSDAVDPGADSVPDDVSGDDGSEWNGASFNTNLEALDSYTAKFTYEDGSGDNKQAWSWQQSVIRDPRAMEMYSNDKGTESTAGAYRLVQIGDRVYSVSNDPVQCIMVVNQPQNQGLSPDSVIAGLPFSMRKDGPGEAMFGRATDRYSYTGTDFDGTSYQATALVDRDGGFAYRYQVIGERKNGDAVEPFTWNYELIDVNSVPTIEIPSECENVGNGAKWPLPEGATMTMQTNEMMSYDTPQQVDELAAFYAEEMPKAGYSPAEGGMTTDTSVMANFTKDGKTVTIIMTYQDGKTTVIITQQG